MDHLQATFPTEFIALSHAQVPFIRGDITNRRKREQKEKKIPEFLSLPLSP
jgi:hypothetical protein